MHTMGTVPVYFLNGGRTAGPGDRAMAHLKDQIHSPIPLKRGGV